MDSDTLRAKVHTSYPPHNPPLHPEGSWTRFVCVSDTHSRVYHVPPGDVLLHAGDLSSWGSYEQLQFTVNWLKTLPHQIKIIVAGNHDLSLDLNWKGPGSYLNYQLLDPEEVNASRNLMHSPDVRRAGIFYLENQPVTVTLSNGISWKFYGSPAAPLYAVGAFQYETRSEAEVLWSRIPSTVEVLLTHTPPFGKLDLTRRGKQAGCRDLAAQLDSLNQCRLHVFGHIHEAHGAVVTESKAGGKECMVSVNAALAAGGQAIIVDLQK